MQVRSIAALAVWGVLAGGALAAEQPYVASGALNPFVAGSSTYGFMEVWGVGGFTRYANPATDAGDAYHGLIAGAESASVSALSGFSAGVAAFSYDAAASPVFVSASGNSARYTVGPMSVQLSGASLLSLAAGDMQMTVGRNTTGHSQNVFFTRTAATSAGPLPGSSFSYGAAPEAATVVDLVSLLGPSAYFASGFDLSAFGTLPVRLTAPTEFRPVGFSVQFLRNDPAVTFGIAPPATLQLADWNRATDLTVYFDGSYGVSVDPADFASNDAYLAASTWVGANIRQINYEQALSYTIDAVAAVPEPGAAWMMLAALPWLLRARRRAAA